MSRQFSLAVAAVILGALAAWDTAAAASPAARSAAAAGPPQSRDGQNRRVRIHNQTGWTMVRFQAADARTRAWQGDELGAQPIATGASTVVTIDDGTGACVYVFRAEFSNGQTLERAAVNVCEIADYYLTR